MMALPITRMVLYKHGVGFFERRATLDGDQVTLSFPVEAMNDILKSLTAVDWGDGQVLGLAYATPQSQEERLAGCSVRLSEGRSLQDLLTRLRGRRVRLLLDQEQTVSGALLGLDEAPKGEPLATALVSLLLDDSAEVQTVALGRVQGVELLDDQAAADLRFFLQTALGQDDFRQVTIRLTPGQHELSVSYVAPAPTWRVSYRLVVENATPGSGGGRPEQGPGQREHSSSAQAGLPGTRKALLQGWGIFDNRLEEDLTDISLSLVAGMPISFVYDLYTPFTPERPEVEEEARVAAAPVQFEQARPARALRGVDEAEPAMGLAVAAAPAREMIIRRMALEKAAPAIATGKDLGERFQYTIQKPVTVGRGQSAMVPIVLADLACRKDLLYNGHKLPVHPVATLRLKNETGLTLERGPVTVLEEDQPLPQDAARVGSAHPAGGQAGRTSYAGEALLPFTPAGGEIVVPYAVELGAKVREESGARREIHGLRIKGHYLHIEEWDVRWRDYQISNSTSKPLDVLVEHPRTRQYDLFDTPQPQEHTDEHLRFPVEVPAHDETTLRVQERRLVSRREELRRVSARSLQGYLKRGLLSQRDHDQMAELLVLWEQIASHEERLQEIEQERNKIYTAQQQIQGNMQALSTTGKEGALRASYVDRLRASEEELQKLATEESRLKAEIAQLRQEVESRIKALS